MSTTTTSSFSASQRSSDHAQARSAQARLSLVERGALALAIFEIPLQVDKYFGRQDVHGELGAVAGLNVSITLIALVFLYVIWFATGTLRTASNVKRWMIGTPMIIYISLIGLSVVTAEVQFLAICDLFLVLQAYMLFFYVANRIEDLRDLQFSLMVLAATLVTQCFLIFGLVSLGEAAWGQRFDVGPIALLVWEGGRPAGTMHSAVLAGSVMGMIWLPIMGLSLTSASRTMKRWAIVALAIGLLGIMLTQTRGAIGTTIIGAGVIGFAALTRGWLPRQAIIATLVLGLISIVPLISVIRGRVLGDDGGSAIARKHLTVIAIEMIKSRPLFGYGAGNCHLAGKQFADTADYRAEWYYTIHCKYLLTWIETGVFGFLAFLCVIGNGVRQGWKTWLSKKHALAPIGLALAIAIIGHMIHMLVDIFNSRTQVQMLWLMLGLTAATYRLSQSYESTPAMGEFSHGR